MNTTLRFFAALLIFLTACADDSFAPDDGLATSGTTPVQITNTFSLTNQLWITNTVTVTNVTWITNSTYDTDPPADGETAFMLDDTGQVVRSITVALESTPVGTALVFDGSGHASILSSPTIDFPGYGLTVSLWLRWDTDPHAWAAANASNRWANLASKNGDNQWQLQHAMNNNLFEFAIRTDAGRAYLQGTTVPQQGTWYQITGTWDGSTMRLYVNGVLEKTRNWSGSLVTSPAPLEIGRRSVVNDRPFHGAIAGLVVGRIPWSPAQVAAAYGRLK